MVPLKIRIPVMEACDTRTSNSWPKPWQPGWSPAHSTPACSHPRTKDDSLATAGCELGIQGRLGKDLLESIQVTKRQQHSGLPKIRWPCQQRNVGCFWRSRRKQFPFYPSLEDLSVCWGSLMQVLYGVACRVCLGFEASPQMTTYATFAKFGCDGHVLFHVAYSNGAGSGH